MSDTTKTVIAFIFLAICIVAGGILQYDKTVKCEAAGGVLVRASFGWECVKGVK